MVREREKKSVAMVKDDLGGCVESDERPRKCYNSNTCYKKKKKIH